MEYHLIRSARRTVSLSVQRDGTVLVRAPLRMPRSDIERFVADHRDWIARHQKRQWVCQEEHPQPTPEEQEQLRRAAHAVLPERVAYWSSVIGVQPTAIRITSARTRFGSCSGKNSVNFSLYLMQYPAEAVDYVVVHELCHILHHDHSPAFWAEVAHYMPDYRRRQAMLKA